MPAPFETTPSLGVAEAWELLTAGTWDLTTRTGKPQRCARRVIAIGGAQDWTELRDSGGVDAPLGAVPAMYLHDGHTSAITCSGTVGVMW